MYLIFAGTETYQTAQKGRKNVTRRDSKVLLTLISLVSLVSLAVAWVIAGPSSASTVGTTSLISQRAEETIHENGLNMSCVEADVSYIQQTYSLSTEWHRYAVDFVKQIDGSGGRSDMWVAAGGLGISEVPWATSVFFDCWQ